MARCNGFKPDGTPCERIVSASQRFCFAHDPATAAARARNASRAAKSKPLREIKDLKDEVKAAVKDVREGTLDRNDAKVMFSGYALVKDLLSLERDLRIDDELAAEVEELKREIDRHAG
jgi:hypothetical protein